EQAKLARRAVDDMYTGVAEQWLAYHPDLDQVQRDFLEKALAFYQKLTAAEAADPALRFEVGKAHFRVGEIDQGLRRVKEADAAYRQAAGIFEALSAAF